MEANRYFSGHNVKNIGRKQKIGNVIKYICNLDVKFLLEVLYLM